LLIIVKFLYAYLKGAKIGLNFSALAVKSLEPGEYYNSFIKLSRDVPLGRGDNTGINFGGAPPP